MREIHTAMQESPHSTEDFIDIHAELLSELGQNWAITHRTESSANTYGLAHSYIYATPHERKLSGLTCDILRAAVAEHAGEMVVNACCTIEFEVIDVDGDYPESRPYLTYTGAPETMAQILAGLHAATVAHNALQEPMPHAS